MNVLMQELLRGIPDGTEAARVLIRLTAALTAGAVVGLQRERSEKPAGLRTHMLVALGSTLFVLAAVQTGMPPADISRIIQGIATGIGFLGAGVILKLMQEHKIKGLTTAADIWTTAAIGVTIGLGAIGIGLIGAGLAWIVLGVMSRWEGSHRQ
jgi:putative Mg2+ transporter-C (MgtC) family protein